MGKQKDEKHARKLTKAEQKRREQFEKTKEAMEAEGYCSRDLTIGIAYANVMAFVFGLPLIFLLAVFFILINGKIEWLSVFRSPVQILLFWAALILLVVVHEGIHGFFWALNAKGRFRAISFGFILNSLTPYCTCSEPLKKGQYILGTVMPTVLLGILPGILSAFLGWEMLLALSCLLVLCGGGDLTIIWKVLQDKGSQEKRYLDHPYEAGVFVFEKLPK